MSPLLQSILPTTLPTPPLRQTPQLRPMPLISLTQDHSQAQNQLLLRMPSMVHHQKLLLNGRLIKSKRNLKMPTKPKKPQLLRFKLNQTLLTLTTQSHSQTQLQFLLRKLKRAILQTRSQLRRLILRLQFKLNPALRLT